MNIKKNQIKFFVTLSLVCLFIGLGTAQIIKPPIVNPNQVDVSKLSTNWTPNTDIMYFVQIKHSEEDLFLTTSGDRLGSILVIQKKTKLGHDDKSSELWRITPDRGGWYYIKHVRSGLFLHAKGGQIGTETGLDLQRKRNIEAQKFRFIATRTGIQIVPKLNQRMAIAPKSNRIQSGTHAVFQSSSTNNLNLSFLEAATYEYSMQITCISESDPGSEIELYGKIQAEVSQGRQAIKIGSIWKKTEDQAIDLAVRQSVSVNPWYFILPKKWAESGRYSFTMTPSFYEDDSTSKDDSFVVVTRSRTLTRPGRQEIYCEEEGSKVIVKVTLSEFILN